ncbi:hypothetical protein ACQ4PT_019263 [Festuca glaucescens]
MAERKWSLGMMSFAEERRLAERRAKREEEAKVAEERRQTKLRRKLIMLQICLASPWAIEQMAKGWRPQLSGQGIEEQIVVAQGMLDLKDPDDPMREMARQGLEELENMPLEIKQASEGSHHVPGIVEAKVENISEVWDVLQTGSNSRAVGSNNVNEHSSRSHCMLCIMVRAKNLINGDCTRSKLWLVDLAGSERLVKTDAQGDRLKEAQNINRSLSALGDVISALASRSSHIPYRNSKLTHLLQDSLGGDSKALMFVQISPSDNDVSETLSSLNFASRVRGIELGPAKKQVDTAELQKLKQMLERSKQEARLKDDSLKKLEENCQNLENKAKGKEQLYKSLQEKMNSQITSEKQQCQLSGKLKEKEEICTALQQKIVELERKVRQQQQSDSEAAVLKQTIEELELKLKEQEQQRAVAESKAREIGQELLEAQKTESTLQSKLLDVEKNLQERTTLEDATMIAQETEPMLESKLLDVEKKLQEGTKLEDSELMPAPSVSMPRVPTTPVEAKVAVLPSPREEAMSEKAGCASSHPEKLGLRQQASP